MTPVVAVLTDLAILDILKPSEGEVDLIFDHPLEALLEPSLSAQEPLVELNSDLWPSDADYYVGIWSLVFHTCRTYCVAHTELYGQPMDLAWRFYLSHASFPLLCVCNQGVDRGNPRQCLQHNIFPLILCQFISL